MTIEPVTLQSLTSSLGEYHAIRQCAPVDFYMLLYGAGYLPKELKASTFCQMLDEELLHTHTQDWSRPALTRYLRHKYGAAIISWQFGWSLPNDYELMKKSGYIETAEELEFLKTQIEGKSVENIVKAGFPVMVTMKPGMGTSENHNIHAVIIVQWADDAVTIVDPDARNPASVFAPEHIRSYMSPTGAGTIVLPRS